LEAGRIVGRSSCQTEVAVHGQRWSAVRHSPTARNRLYKSVFVALLAMSLDVTPQLREAVLRQAQAQNLTEVHLRFSPSCWSFYVQTVVSHRDCCFKMQPVSQTDPCDASASQGQLNKLRSAHILRALSRKSAFQAAAADVVRCRRLLSTCLSLLRPHNDSMRAQRLQQRAPLATLVGE